MFKYVAMIKRDGDGSGLCVVVQVSRRNRARNFVLLCQNLGVRRYQMASESERGESAHPPSYLTFRPKPIRARHPTGSLFAKNTSLSLSGRGKMKFCKKGKMREGERKKSEIKEVEKKNAARMCMCRAARGIKNSVQHSLASAPVGFNNKQIRGSLLARESPLVNDVSQISPTAATMSERGSAHAKILLLLLRDESRFPKQLALSNALRSFSHIKFKIQLGSLI